MPESLINGKGKVRKVYRWYATPWEILRQIPDLARYLRPELTESELNEVAGMESDTSSARRMQQAKRKLFSSIQQRRSA